MISKCDNLRHESFSDYIPYAGVGLKLFRHTLTFFNIFIRWSKKKVIT